MNKIYDLTREATLLRVIDGDTVDIRIDIDLGFHSKATVEPRVRLARIDAPEIRGKYKAEGKLSKQWLEDTLARATEMLVRTEKDDAFGRWVAEIWLTINDRKGINLSDLMVQHGYAAYKHYK